MKSGEILEPGASASLADVCFELSPVSMWVFDVETLGFLAVNDAALSAYGYSRQRFLTLSLLDIRPLEDHPLIKDWFGKSDLTRSVRSTGRWNHLRSDGSVMKVDVANSRAIVYGGRRAVVATVFDVTDSNERVGTLEAHRVALHEAQELAELGSFIFDAEDRVFSIGGILVRILGRDELPFAEAASEVGRIWYADDDAERRRLLKSLDHFEPYDGEFRLWVGNEARWFHGSTKVIRDGDGSVTGAVGVMLDITDHKLEEERLRQLVFTDPATGLLNRASLLEDVALQGFPFGELVLVRVTWITEAAHRSQNARVRTAQAVASTLRIVAPDDAMVFRYSDQAFAILTRKTEPARSALELAQRIAAAFERPLATGSGDYLVIPTIGVAAATDAGCTIADLARRGEAALHEAERTHERIAVYTDALEKSHDRRATIERNLRRAIEDRRVSVVYQPFVSLATGKIVGAEALMRWECPGLGVVPPDEFIAIAEDSGVILKLGEWILRAACVEARTWQRAGPNRLRIAVNASARQVEQHDFLRVVASACEDAGLSPAELELEITERVMMRRDGVALQNLTALRILGTRISIDDFGTGYSSLSYLGTLPLDTLKLDRGFVVSAETDPFQAKVVASVVSLARERGLSVIAEGVEVGAQRDWLRDIGCHEAQGYLFGRPASAAEFRALVERGNPGDESG